MKRAAIIIAVLAAIAFVVFMYIGNQDAVSGYEQVRPTSAVPSEPVVELPTEPADQVAIQTNDQIVAEGRLVPTRFIELSFKSAGLVSKIYVNEGEIVEDGKLIAVLHDQEEYNAAIASAELEVLNAQQSLNELYKNTPVETAQAYKEFIDADIQVKEAERYLTNLQNSIELDDDQEELQLGLEEAENKLDQAWIAYKPHSDKPDDDAVKIVLGDQLRQIQEEYQALLVRNQTVIGEGLVNKISQASADLILARVEMIETKKKYDILKNGPDPEKVASAEERLKNAEAQLMAAEASLLDLELRAPFKGTITNIDFQEGQYVSPGVTVVMLVDYSAWLLETTDLSELNVVHIDENDPVLINCDAFPDEQFSGLVERINTLGENRQGDITYKVIVKINEVDDRFLWNMTCVLNTVNQ